MADTDPETVVVWADEQWFAYFQISHLSPQSALDYFSHSPFYKYGLEHVLLDAQEPHLFIIQQQRRTSAKQVVRLGLFYILDKNVYKAPSLHHAIHSRLVRLCFASMPPDVFKRHVLQRRCVHYLGQGKAHMQQALDPLHRLTTADTGKEEARKAASMAVMKAAKRQLPEEYERERNIDTALHDLFHKHPLPEQPLQQQDLQQPSHMQPLPAHAGVEASEMTVNKGSQAPRHPQ